MLLRSCKYDIETGPLCFGTFTLKRRASFTHQLSMVTHSLILMIHFTHSHSHTNILTRYDIHRFLSLPSTFTQSDHCQDHWLHFTYHLFSLVAFFHSSRTQRSSSRSLKNSHGSHPVQRLDLFSLSLCLSLSHTHILSLGNNLLYSFLLFLFTTTTSKILKMTQSIALKEDHTQFPIQSQCECVRVGKKHLEKPGKGSKAFTIEGEGERKRGRDSK